MSDGTQPPFVARLSHGIGDNCPSPFVVSLSNHERAAANRPPPSTSSGEAFDCIRANGSGSGHSEERSDEESAFAGLTQQQVLRFAQNDSSLRRT
jgi:hypothetical protein